MRACVRACVRELAAHAVLDMYYDSKCMLGEHCALSALFCRSLLSLSLPLRRTAAEQLNLTLSIAQLLKSNRFLLTQNYSLSLSLCMYFNKLNSRCLKLQSHSRCIM